MSKESRKEQLALFRSWVMEQTSPDYRLVTDENNPSTIVLETACGRGEVTFYAQEIIQLRVVDLQEDRDVFYLHFQIHSLEHACSLFEEMKEALLQLAPRPTARIVLCCSSGLTTAYFAEKLNESAELLGLGYEFKGEPYSNLIRVGAGYDLILIAPQIQYAFEDIQKKLPGKTVLKIPAKIFAAYDVPGLLEMISPYIPQKSAAKKETAAGEKHPDSEVSLVKRNPAIDVSVLAVALISDSRHFHYTYRIYEKSGRVLYESNVLKHRFEFYDLYDICDTALALFPEIEVIGLAMSKIPEKGQPSAPEQESGDADLAKRLSEKLDKRVIVENDMHELLFAGICATCLRDLKEE